VLLRQRERLRGLLLRHFQSPNGRVDHSVARRSKLLGCGLQEEGVVIRPAVPTDNLHFLARVVVTPTDAPRVVGE
jgi:hypothetical protein